MQVSNKQQLNHNLYNLDNLLFHNLNLLLLHHNLNFQLQWEYREDIQYLLHKNLEPIHFQVRLNEYFDLICFIYFFVLLGGMVQRGYPSQASFVPAPMESGIQLQPNPSLYFFVRMCGFIY